MTIAKGGIQPNKQEVGNLMTFIQNKITIHHLIDTKKRDSPFNMVQCKTKLVELANGSSRLSSGQVYFEFVLVVHVKCIWFKSFRSSSGQVYFRLCYIPGRSILGEIQLGYCS